MMNGAPGSREWRIVIGARGLKLAPVSAMVLTAAITLSASAQSSSLLLEQAPPRNAGDSGGYFDPAAQLHGLSLYTVAPAQLTEYAKHDLIRIIIRESSSVRSSQELTTNKEYDIKAEIKAFPQLMIEDLFNAVIRASANARPPKLDISAEKEFEGDGEYKRSDDFTAEITAEVIEVLPNGNLVIEARTRIKTDQEEAMTLLSGVCSPRDITPAGTILSNQLFDLQVIKLHEGELKRTTQRGLIARILDTIFAF